MCDTSISMPNNYLEFEVTSKRKTPAARSKSINIPAIQPVNGIVFLTR